MPPEKKIKRGDGRFDLTPAKVGIPPRPFLYTLDQISALLSLEISALLRGYLYFAGRSTGIKTRKMIEAKNIAPENEPPEWRVLEAELVRWMRHVGFKYSERGSFH